VKLYFVLIFTAVMMAFATGYAALSLRGPHVATDSDIAEIDLIKKDFLKWVSPRQIVNFNSIYYTSDQFKLLDPSFTISSLQAGLSSDRFYSSDKCFSSVFSNRRRYFDEKTLVWEDYRCGRRLKLPRKFFLRAPFIHPSGQSYTFLAFKLGKDNYGNASWVRRYLPFFHVLELSDLKENFGRLPGIFNLLESVGSDAISSIAQGKESILTSDFLFVKLTYPRLPSVVEYRVYDRLDLDRFLKDSPFILANYRPGKSCFFRDGNVCWNYNVRHIFKLANKSSLFLIFGLIIIVIVVVRLLLVKLREQAFEDEKIRLALRVLTHEFRTPIASLMLEAERFGKKYDDFDDELEEIYLNISREVSRLKRLTETSRNYLKADKSSQLMNLQVERIPSVNDFVYEIAMPYLDKHHEKITFSELDGDSALKIDTYWMGIVVKNLIENAINHGEFPIVITISKTRFHLCICVEDQGTCQFESLGIMTQEFVKGNKSTGTGLGMNIVKKVCREMGVELKLSLSPTTFTLKIPLGTRGKNVR